MQGGPITATNGWHSSKYCMSKLTCRESVRSMFDVMSKLRPGCRSLAYRLIEINVTPPLPPYSSKKSVVPLRGVFLSVAKAEVNDKFVLKHVGSLPQK